MKAWIILELSDNLGLIPRKAHWIDGRGYVCVESVFMLWKILKYCFFLITLAKKTFLGQNKSFWGPLELVEKLVPEAAEITASVKDLPGLK